MSENPSNFAPMYEEVANVIGADDTVKLYEYFKGQQICFPQRLYKTDYVVRYVKENYNGSNIRELARTFGYTERRIRQLLKENTYGDEGDQL